MRFGTPLARNAMRVMLLGSGELGKEVLIALQRLGVETIAVDRYENAPGQQVAHHARVITMSDPAQLKALIEAERPMLVVPEIEAIATPVLEELEADGLRVVPTARAARLTMDREGIRRLAAEELGLPTSPYRFCDSLGELEAAVAALGTPCVVKPVMSSSGKGQSVVRAPADAAESWEYAQTGGRTGAGRVIAEGFVDFDYEITLLTVRHAGGTSFCEPIGHLQIDGDYRESWQPHPMAPRALEESRRIAAAITASLGGRGIFGVELFVKGEQVWFSEVSPRPHDTGLVTLISQDLSEFALHARAILGLPVDVGLLCPGASAVIYGAHDAPAIAFEGNGPVDVGRRVPLIDLGLLVEPAQVRLVAGVVVTEMRRVARLDLMTCSHDAPPASLFFWQQDERPFTPFQPARALRHRMILCAAQQRGGHATVLGRLVNDAEQLARLRQSLAKAILLALEGVEAAAQHERELILQHVPNGAQLALVAQPAAQQTRLAVGSAIAELGEVQRDQAQLADVRRQLLDGVGVGERHRRPLGTPAPVDERQRDQDR